MTDFKIEIHARTTYHDADVRVMMQFPEALLEKFHGTSIEIISINVKNVTLSDKTLTE